MKRRIYGMLSILLLCCVLLTGLSLTAFATGGTGDATLSGLEVSPGTLTPEFSSDVYEYQVEVGSECDKLLVNAKTTDSGAKMVIAGNDGLKAGSNTVIINVTAADGVTKAKYTITAVRGTAGSPGQTTAAPSAPSQTGESLGSSPLSGPNVGGSAPVGTSAAESQSTATQPSAGTITTEGKTYTLSEPSEDLIPSGFIAADVTIGGQTVKGWRFPDSSQADEFYLIYGTSGTGRTAFFIYDAGEGSVITAPESVLTMNQESQISQNQLKTAQSGYQKTLKMRLWIIIGLAILCFILLIALTASMTRHRHRDDFYEDDEADELYEDDRYEDERELSPRDRARRAYERGEESYSDYEEEYDDLDEEPTGGRMWASTEAHAQKAKAAEAAPAGDFADLDSLEEEFEDLDLSGEEFEEPAVSYEEPVEPDSPGEEFEDLDFSDEEFEGPAVSYEEPVEAASPEEEFPVVEIPEKFFDEARAEQDSGAAEEIPDELDDDFDLFDLDMEEAKDGEPEEIPELYEDDIAEVTEGSDVWPEEEDSPEEDDFEDLDLTELVRGGMETSTKAEPFETGRKQAPEVVPEESVVSDDEDDLDADFDLLEALLSDSVRSGKPEGKNSIVNRAAEKAGQAGRKADNEKAPVNPVRELGRKKP